MRLFNYLRRGCPSSGRLAGEWGIDLPLAVVVYSISNPEADSTPVPFDSLVELFASGSRGLTLIKAATDWILDRIPDSDKEFRSAGVIFDPHTVEFLPPVPPTAKILCIAGNYPAPGKLEKPAHPTVFLKPASGNTLDRCPVKLPHLVENAACEVELAVMIGQTGRHLERENALDCVAGFTLANDLGDRLLEKRTSQWTSGKMFDTFTPFSPIIITPDELEAPIDRVMRAKVNDEVVQFGHTGDMFFDVPDLISYLSDLTTLQPGDVILTGSPKLMQGEPQPVVSLKPGDRVEIFIAGLGSVSNPVISEGQEV